MVKVKYKLKGQKWRTMNVKTMAEAKKLKKFIGKEGKTEISYIRKPSKKRAKHPYLNISRW